MIANEEQFRENFYAGLPESSVDYATGSLPVSLSESGDSSFSSGRLNEGPVSGRMSLKAMP
jgi:hypothetical protein